MFPLLSTSCWLLGFAGLVGRIRAIRRSHEHAVLAELGLTHISLASLAKREAELWVPGWDEPVVLPNGSPSLYLVKRVRDEAHRFAIEYHRDLRGKAMTAPVLAEIPGVGPKRKKALLKHFGGIRKLRATNAEQIAAVPGVTRDVAEAVAEALRGE